MDSEISIHVMMIVRRQSIPMMTIDIIHISPYVQHRPAINGLPPLSIPHLPPTRQRRPSQES